MEKFFIHILDVIKYLEVKAQEKSQRKKYWVLGNPKYLQPVDDVDEGKKCLDHDFKKKAQCIYQAARCGMKEGVLTGVFLGGFYGLIRSLNENVSNALIPSSLINVNSSEEGKDQSVTEKNSTVNEKDNINTVQSDNDNYEPQSDFGEQTLIRDNASKNKKRGKSTFTKSEPPDRGNKEFKMERRQSSVGQSANENLFSKSVTNFENSNSKSREREKVEIVGYAFIQNLETRDSESSAGTASDDSDKRKGDNQKEEEESESQNRSEAKSRVNSDEGGRSSGSTYPKDVLGSIKEVHKRKKQYKKDGESSQIEQTKSSSGSSQESYPAQVLLDTKSKPNILDSQKGMKSSGKSTNVQGKQKSVSDKGKIGSNKGSKKIFSKGSRVSIEPRESRDNKSDSKHGDKNNKSKNRFHKFEKGKKTRKVEASKSRVFNAFYENIFIPSKISKSILVDADVISNGYSLSLNNESLTSNEKFDPLSEANFDALGASGQVLHHIVEKSKNTIKDDDTVSHNQKKLAFVEPEIFSYSREPSVRFESSTPSLAQIHEDSSSNSESVDSTSSDSDSGQVTHTSTTEDINEPAPVESIQSLKEVSGDNQPGSDQSVKPSSKSTVVGSTPVVSGYNSPKAMSIGDSAQTSFVQNLSKEFFRDKTSNKEIVGNELITNKVRAVKESKSPSSPKSGFLLLKNISDSLILLSACNCAVVLGVLCAVVKNHLKCTFEMIEKYRKLFWYLTLRKKS